MFPRFLCFALLASMPVSIWAKPLPSKAEWDVMIEQIKQEKKDAERRLEEMDRKMQDPYSVMGDTTLPSGKKISGKRYLNMILQGIPAEGDMVFPAHMKTSGGKKPLKLEWSVDVVGSTFLPGPEVRLADSEMIFAGTGSERALGGVDFTGRTLVVITDDGGLSRGVRTNRDDLLRQWRNALDRGAAAVLWVTSTEPALQFWDSMRATWAGINQSPEYRDASGRALYPLKVAGILSHKGAGKIFANAGVDFDASVAAARQPGFRAFALPMKASMTLQVRPADEFNPDTFKIPD